MSQRRTIVLVDGENIDATLGNNVLGRRPAPEERPRWERVTEFVAAGWDQPVTGLFFLNATNGALPNSFVQALLAMDYRPVPLAGDGGEEKVVDVGIQRTLTAIAADPDLDVVLLSHDADFAEDLGRLVDGTRQVAVIGFREYVSNQLTQLGVKVFDLEDDVRAFQQRLPRTRIIPLSTFNPVDFLY
jgi:putative heme uptake system protein